MTEGLTYSEPARNKRVQAFSQNTINLSLKLLSKYKVCIINKLRSLYLHPVYTCYFASTSDEFAHSDSRKRSLEMFSFLITPVHKLLSVPVPKEEPQRKEKLG